MYQNLPHKRAAIACLTLIVLVSLTVYAAACARLATPPPSPPPPTAEPTTPPIGESLGSEPPWTLAGGAEPSNVTHFNNLSTADLEVTGDVTAAGVMTIADDLTASDDLIVEGNLALAQVLSINTAGYTQSGAKTLSPIRSIYSVNPGDVLTLTLGTTGVELGQLAFFINISANNVTIVDTGHTAGGGDRTLGQDDVIGFIYTARGWLEAFYSDNS
jgi:hypothetical protein